MNRLRKARVKKSQQEKSQHMDLVYLENTDIKIWTHKKNQCMGEQCTIHNLSKHSMRSFPQHWRGDRGIMERICKHGVGHPDPDDYRCLNDASERVHGCCGCCVSSDLNES